MDSLYNFVNSVKTLDGSFVHSEYFGVFIFNVCVTAVLTSIMLIAYLISKRSVDTELLKLKSSDSKFEKITMIVSGIVLSWVVVTIGVLLTGVVSKLFGHILFYQIPEDIFYTYIKLMFTFSAILIIGYILVSPQHPSYRLVNIPDDGAEIIHRKSVRLVAISFIIIAVSYPMVMALKKHALRAFVEFGTVSAMICYYFIEFSTLTRFVRQMFNISQSEKVLLAQKLVLVVSSKFHYVALAGMLCISVFEISNNKDDGFSIVSCMNKIYMFLISMFVFQSLMSYLINRLNRYIEKLHRSNKPKRYINRVTANTIWISNICVCLVYFLMLCLGLYLLGFDVVSDIIHSKAAIFMTVVFFSMLVCKIYEEYKEELLENAANGDKDHYEKLRVFVVPISVVFYVVVIVTSLMVTLAAFGVDIIPILVNSSLLAGAVWYATEDIIQSFLKGVVLMAERNISVGEFVKIDGLSGTVEKLSTRVMYLRDLNGSVNIIPYSSVNSITNFSREYSNHEDELLIADAKDVDKAKEILINVVKDMRRSGSYKDIIIGDVVVNGISPFDLRGVRISWTVKTNPEGEHVVEAIYENLIKEFKKHKIKIPSTNNVSLSIC